MRTLDKLAYYLQDKSSSNNGLLGGEIGRALFLSEYGRARDNFNFIDLAEKIIDKTENDIIEGCHSMYYSNGLSGILCGLHIVKSLNVGSKNLLDLSGVELEFTKLIHSYIELRNFDFLAGITGLMLFFNICGLKKQLIEAIELVNKSKIVEGETFFWKTYSKNLYDPNYINMGLSHGMAALFVVIGKSLSVSNQETQINLLNGIYEFYKQNENRGKYCSIFPYGITESKKNQFSRLAWCYGDVGIGSSFLTVGNSIGNSDFTNYGTRILLAASLRRDMEFNLVTDPFFCHGTSGLLMVFFNAYKITGERSFYDAYTYWHEMTLSLLEKRSWQDCSVGILDGLSGIGLSLLSLEYKKNLSWEKLLLIN